MEITEASAETLSSTGGTRIVKVTATVENSGQLATHLARGAELAGNREDAIWLIGDRDRVKYLQGGAWQSLGVLQGTMAVPDAAPAAGARGGQRAAQPANQQPTQRQMQMMQQFQGRGGGAQQGASQTGNTREVTWLVSMEGNAPLKLVLTSQKGGTKVHNLTVR